MQQLGPYLLEAELGRGGMGVVWRAHDPALDRTVAIKVILTAFAGPEDLARFRREALAQARLRHPAIVGVHTAGSTPTGQPYLVMDHVEGESLAQRLKRDGPLAPVDAARVVARLARAVHYAHARGVLHRDLKARNVLLDGAGEPVLIDFGLAALAGRERLTASGEVVGTPGCMAPELALGDRSRISPKTDIYGLGALLFEALTARPPFRGDTLASLLLQVVERPAAAPSSLQPGVPADLDAITLRCLEKDPARRFPSAEALAEALEGLGRAAPPATRRGGLVGLVGALVVGLGGGLVGGALVRGSVGDGPGPAPGLVAVSPAADEAELGSSSPPGDAAALPAAVGSGLGAAALARFHVDDVEGALGLAREALASPAARDLARALQVQAASDAVADDHAAAAQALDAAVLLDRSSEVLAGRALGRARRGDQAGARVDLAELARAQEPRWTAFAARTLALLGDEGALEAAERAIERSRGRMGRAFGARALAIASSEGRGDRAAILRDVAEALRLDPRDGVALLVRASRSEGGRDADLAEALRLAKAERDALLMATVLTTRARFDSGAGATDQQRARALADLDEALTLVPGSRRALEQRIGSRKVTVELRGVGWRLSLDALVTDAERLAELSDHDPPSAELLAWARGRRAFDFERGLDASEAARSVAALTRGLERRPGDGGLLGARAELEASLGDDTGAEADALAALETEPRHAPRATAVRARLRWRRGKVREALGLLDEVVARPGGRSAVTLAERAVVHALLRDAERARSDAEAALAIDPKLARGQFARARALMASGVDADLPAVVEALEEAVRLSPGLALARSDLALVRARLGGPAEARQARLDLEAAARLEPWAVEHPVNLAVLLGAASLTREALEALERAVALDPGSPLARINRGRWRLELGQPRLALVDLGVVLERQPWSVEGRSLLARTRYQLADLDGALADADQTLALLGAGRAGPHAAVAHRVRAAILLERGEAKASLSAAEQAVGVEPGDADGLALRGRARALTGDMEGALADLDAALTLGPEHHTARVDLAELLLARGARGDRERAQVELERALRAIPIDDPAGDRARGLLERVREPGAR